MRLRLRVKIVLCLFLVLFAAASFLAVLADLGVFAPSDSAADSGYELRAWEGRIGLFSPPDADSPRTVTDIRLRDLPPTDRVALAAGVPAKDSGEVARLLEDYGS